MLLGFLPVTAGERDTKDCGRTANSKIAAAQPGGGSDRSQGACVCSRFVPVGLDRCERLQLTGAAGVKERIQLLPAVPDLSQQSSVEIKSQHKLVGENQQRSHRSRSVERGDNFM